MVLRNMSCGEYFYVEMSFLALYAVMLVIHTFIAYIGVREIHRLSTENKMSWLLLYAQAGFLASPIAFYVGKALTAVCFCFASQCNTTAYTISYVAYAAHLCCLMLLLYGRLRDVFEGTVFAISKCFRYTFTILLSLLITAGVAVLCMYWISSTNAGWRLARLAEIFVFILALCQVLAWSFVRKLYRIQTSTQGARDQRYDAKFLHFLRKYCVLNLICVMFTSGYALASVITVATQSFNYYWDQTLNIIIMADICTDSLCLLLSFSKYNEQYLRCCCLCHLYCPCLLCLESVDLFQMSRIHSMQQPSTPASSPKTGPQTSPSPQIVTVDDEQDPELDGVGDLQDKR